MPTPSRLTPWVMWAVACTAYFLAVANRTSLSALGPAAQEHFAIEATALSSLAVLQLLVYAAMQVPAGVLIDRFGPRTIMICGTLLMVAGQLAMALVTWFPGVLAARVVVGAGDAAIFTSVLRLVAAWFPQRHIPIINQLSGLLGQMGQLLSVYPLAFVVQWWGWTSGFLGLASAGVLAAILLAVALRNEPDEPARRLLKLPRLRSRPLVEPPVATGSFPVIDPVSVPPSMTLRQVVKEVGQVISIPGVRLGYWTHFATPFSASVILLLWGFPYLVYGAGVAPEDARTLLAICTVTAMVAGVAFGLIIGRISRHRVLFAALVVIVITLVWAVVLLIPTTPPFWLLALLLVITALGGPASVIAFDIVRTHAPLRRLGTATGFVNTGGYTSTPLAILGVGLLLDLQGQGGPGEFTLDGFRLALSLQFVFWIVGLIMMWRSYGPAKRDLEARQGRIA